MNNREPLSTEIVRTVFQRGPVNDQYIDNTIDGSYSLNGKNSKLSAREGKRMLSGESSREYSSMKRMQISLSSAYATMLPSTRFKGNQPRYQFSKEPAPPSPNQLTKSSTKLMEDTDIHEAGVFQYKGTRTRLKTKRRREQCRANQARYRIKQMNRAKMLEETVQRLYLDIPELELQRNQLMCGGQQSIWLVVVEYFQTFRFGVPSTPGGQITPPSTFHLERTNMNQQLQFLRSTMTSDVILGELRGVDSLMEQWRRYSLSFQDLHFQLGSVQRTSETILTAVASLNVTISDATLSYVFPHLLSAHCGDIGINAVDATTAIGNKLLGCRLLLPCSLCFQWDPARCRIVRLETTVNFVAPLMKVLGSVVDAAVALEYALITPDGGISLREDDRSWSHVGVHSEQRYKS